MKKLAVLVGATALAVGCSRRHVLVEDDKGVEKVTTLECRRHHYTAGWSALRNGVDHLTGHVYVANKRFDWFANEPAVKEAVNDVARSVAILRPNRPRSQAPRR